MTGIITLPTIDGTLEMFYAWDARFTQHPPCDKYRKGLVVVTPKIGLVFRTELTLSEIADMIRKSENTNT